MKGVQGAVAFEDMQAFPSGCGEASGNAFCPWESAPYGRALEKPSSSRGRAVR